MAVRAIEIAIECDDLAEDAVPALALMAEAVGIDAENDHIEVGHGADDEGNPVLLARMWVAEPGERVITGDVDGN